MPTPLLPLARRVPLALTPLLAAGCIVTQVRYVPVPAYTAARATSGDAMDAGTGGPCTPEEHSRWGRGQALACEVRTFVLSPSRGPLDFESGNGGVTVEGADTARAATVAAAVSAWAPSDAEAARILAAVVVRADGNALRADGPRDLRDERGWAVDYHATAPRRADLRARTGNGSVRVRDVVGRMRLASGNGSITLDGVGGAVEGQTGNGSVRATLAGRAWDGGGLPGAGLDLHTGNGSAVLRIPDGYSAALSVRTGNGGLTVDFPVTLAGRIDPRRLDLTLGSGGAPVRVETGNGSARLTRAE